MMLFLLPLYMLRRNADVVGGACGCWPCCAKAGAASDVPSNAIVKSLFIMRAILSHHLANRAVLLVQQEHAILRPSTEPEIRAFGGGALLRRVLLADQLQQRLRGSTAVEQDATDRILSALRQRIGVDVKHFPARVVSEDHCVRQRGDGRAPMNEDA